jgi:hypothetical protein
VQRTVRQGCFAFLAFYCTVLEATAQQPAVPKLLPRCGGLFGLCGFVDRETKAEVIPRRFEVVMPFGEGLAGVQP